jgi:hypothetical protein
MTRMLFQRDQEYRRNVQKRRSMEFNVGPRPFPFEHGDLSSQGEDLPDGTLAPSASGE